MTNLAERCEGAEVMTVEAATSAGRVRGRWEGGVAVFRGIPFAAPPVGPNRFAAPQSATPWSGVRDAFRFGPPPPQPGRSTDGEDWLNLSLWTPDPGQAGLPVVVWISGGGYLNCNSANPHLTGHALAGAGAVVVSVHYRGGAEGFLRLPGAPDNRALLDQLAALDWVHTNIAAFGGDPGNVTVHGQSAGAGSIAALLVMPAAAGAFRRAILQSIPGTYFSPDLADGIAAEICSVLGVSTTVAAVGDVAPDTLVAAAQTITERLPQRADRWGAVAHTPTPFSPVVDGDVLPAPPWSAVADGAARDVELLIGHGRDEYSLLAAQLPDIDDADVDPLIERLTPTPGASCYRAAFPDLAGNELCEAALSDWLFRMPALHLAEAAATAGARVWLYELLWGFGRYGASHGLDTLLVFGTTDIDGEVTAAGPTALAHTQRLSATIRADHLAFANTGDPGWTRFRRRERLMRVYDPEPALIPYPEERSRTIWRGRRFGVLDHPGTTGISARARPDAP
jgi:para-nitrobenzyl esterase